MKITVDDLVPGRAFKAHNQGTCITPQIINVTVIWVGPDTVHYRVSGDLTARATTIQRFLGIINDV